MARPFKEDKKISVGVRLPPWMNTWFKDQDISKSKLIEAALCEQYNISAETIHLYQVKANLERLDKLCKS